MTKAKITYLIISLTSSNIADFESNSLIDSDIFLTKRQRKLEMILGPNDESQFQMNEMNNIEIKEMKFDVEEKLTVEEYFYLMNSILCCPNTETISLKLM